MKKCPKCKACVSEVRAARYAANPDERERARKSPQRRDKHLRKHYDITYDEYEVLWEEQHGRCAICGQPENGRKLSVDHDHETLAIRGLLCLQCNALLGMCGDRLHILDAAATYLRSTH